MIFHSGSEKPASLGQKPVPGASPVLPTPHLPRLYTEGSARTSKKDPWAQVSGGPVAGWGGRREMGAQAHFTLGKVRSCRGEGRYASKYRVDHRDEGPGITGVTRGSGAVLQDPLGYP